MYTDMLEDIRDGSQSHTIINMIEFATIYMITLSKYNRNEKKRYYLRKTWVNVYTMTLRLL